MKDTKRYNLSALMSAYNYAKTWARRTGLTTEDRVDRALGYMMSGEAPEKWIEYRTHVRKHNRDWVCGCRDHYYRGSICKHILSKMIDIKYHALMDELRGDGEEPQDEAPTLAVNERHWSDNPEHYKMRGAN